MKGGETGKVNGASDTKGLPFEHADVGAGGGVRVRESVAFL